MQVAILGAGLVGRRTAEFLATDPRLNVALISHRREITGLSGVAVGRGWPHPHAAEATTVVLAIESVHHVSIAKEFLRAGINVVSTADDPAEVHRLWALDSLAQTQGAALVVGAAYSPGVSTLLAAHLARGMDEVSAITTAQFGTGGPACAREHHRAMSGSATEVYRGELRPTRGGTGRELIWFPEPIGAADCYRAGLADPFLLFQRFPGVPRIESRQAATRRDRLTARLPMLRPPHREGLAGAVWAEVRGRLDGRVEHRSMAATAPQATGAAAMAASFCWELAAADRGEGSFKKGASSAANCENTISLLQHILIGVRLWAYDGSQIVNMQAAEGQIRAARKWGISRETA